MQIVVEMNIITCYHGRRQTLDEYEHRQKTSNERKRFSTVSTVSING
jgi:hypothetical protein